MKKIKEILQQQQFNPGFIGIFINPFYFVRRALFREIKLLAQDLDGKMLDVGCGVKPYKELFINIEEYVGMEYDSPGNRSKQRGEVFYDGTNFPFEANVFDSIIFTQVLEHIFNPDEFLSEVNRVLKEKGLILLTTPFVWDEHAQPYDFGRYSSFGLEHLLKKHGFKIIKHHKTLSDIRAIFQLINCYLYKVVTIKNYKVRLLFYVFLFSPFTILGTILYWILPKNTDLYMDNVILAQKI